MTGTVGPDGTSLALDGTATKVAGIGLTQVTRLTLSATRDAAARMQGTYTYVEELHSDDGYMISTRREVDLRSVVLVPWS